MKQTTLALAVLIGLLTSSSAQAVDWAKIFCVKWCVPHCSQPACCDDYCPKCEPCVPQICRFGCDDYCPKCEPCVPQIRCFGCDDYCPKCPPKLICPPCSDLRCVPTSGRPPCTSPCR